MFRTLLTALLITFLCASYSFGATVSKVKGSGVLIKNPEKKLSVGSYYYLVNSEGKKIGIVQIKKVQPGKSIGKLVKGKARPNLRLVKRKSSKKTTTSGASSKKKSKKSSAPPPERIAKKPKKSKKSKKSKSGFGKLFSGDKRMGVGFATGFSSNSSDVTFLNSSGQSIREDSYTGTSLSFELIFDYELLRKWYIRASLGQQNFETGDENNTQCVGNGGQTGAECIVDLTYINLDLWLHYYFTQNRFKIWAGAGIGLLLAPDGGTTTALNQDDIATTTFFQFGAGADISINDKLYIPVWAEYGLFPPSDTVDMRSISGYVGIAYRL